MLANTAFGLTALAALASATPLVMGPGPVVTVHLCDSSNNCTIAPLDEGNCVDLATTEPAYNHDVAKFTIGPLFSTAPAISCVLYADADCGTSGGQTTIVSPGGDVPAEWSDKASSYLCSQ